MNFAISVLYQGAASTGLVVSHTLHVLSAENFDDAVCQALPLARSIKPNLSPVDAVLFKLETGETRKYKINGSHVEAYD